MSGKNKLFINALNKLTKPDLPPRERPHPDTDTDSEKMKNRLQPVTHRALFDGYG